MVELDGERVEVGPNQFCCFPQGCVHAVVETRAPLKALMLRAPSVDDKE